MVKQTGTRNPMKIASEIGVMLRYSEEFDKLLGLYTYRWKHRIILLNDKMEETKMSEEAKDDVRQVTVERLQRSHGRLIQVVSVFPVQGSATPEDKLKALIDLDAQQGKLCA